MREPSGDSEPQRQPKRKSDELQRRQRPPVRLSPQHLGALALPLSGGGGSVSAPSPGDPGRGKGADGKESAQDSFPSCEEKAAGKGGGGVA